MIRHTVLLRFVADADPGAIAAYARDLAELPHLIPGVVEFSFGADVGKRIDHSRASNWDFVVTAAFETYDDYKVYADHPDHHALVAKHLDQLMEDRAALQIEG